jgi:hypothetical protein
MAENGVLTRVYLPDRGTKPANTRVGVHRSLQEAIMWVEDVGLDYSEEPENDAA